MNSKEKAIEQLKATIYQSLPDLMKLGVGCEIMHSYKDEILKSKIIDISKSEYFSFDMVAFYNEEKGLFEEYINDIENFTILGRPITLPDVLRWIKGLEIFKNRVGRRGNLGYIDERAELLEMWNYLKYTIDEQSDQLIEFLFNLKKE